MAPAMTAMPPEAPEVPEPPPAAPPGAPEVQRHARYNHLLGRLRTRQITMEEATELFALMQAMLRASEAAARRASIATMTGATPPSSPLSRPPRAAPAASSVPDDMFLVGILAMGAGAGLLAAMARRLADAGSPRDERDKDPTVPRNA